jgi:hypothetical protein
MEEGGESSMSNNVINYIDVYERLSAELQSAVPQGYAATKKLKRKSRMLQGLAGWYLNSEEYQNLLLSGE